MLHVALRWAEEYHKLRPDVEIEVSGGGSATGFKALFEGTADIANASGPIKPEEVKAGLKRNPDRTPLEIVVGYDALSVFVHNDNPVEQLSLEQLKQIFAEDGSVSHWSQLGVILPHPNNDVIERISRQSNSGTFEFFREHVLDNRDFKQGTLELNGTKEVVTLVSETPTAIGYGGVGHVTSAVKSLKLIGQTDGPAFAPTVENVLRRRYPLTRPLLVYALGVPREVVSDYIQWIRSEDGQKILLQCGYVPIPRLHRTMD
jgi:phosphate transport system substrate-binding protein